MMTDIWQVLVADNLYQNTGGGLFIPKDDSIILYFGGEISNVMVR